MRGFIASLVCSAVVLGSGGEGHGQTTADFSCETAFSGNIIGDCSNGSSVETTWVGAGYVSVESPPVTRGVMVFNTTTIPAGATISSASITFNTVGGVLYKEYTLYLMKYDGSTSSSPPSLEVSDFARFNTILGSIPNIQPVSGPYTFSNISTSVIGKGVYTKLGLRICLDLYNCGIEDQAWIWLDESTITLTVAYSAPECPEPVANFSASPDSGCAPLQVQFTDLSTQTGEHCPITSWSWDFSDGQTSTEQNPTHTYTSSGNYIVSLTVTNNQGGSNTKTSGEGFIKVIDCPDPTVNFIADPDSGCAPLMVTFSDLSTQGVAECCSIVSWDWDFDFDSDDDEPSTEQNPVYTYNKSGKYWVSLKVTNNQGGSKIGGQYIKVIDCCPYPVCDFSAFPDSGCTPLQVQFTDQSTQTGTFCYIESWSWDFGDGQTSAEQNPTHTYTSSGNYIVSLTVTNNQGSSNTKTSGEGFIKVIDCCPVPEAYFSASPDSGCTPLQVQFTDQSTQTGEGCSIVSWTWYFGGGGISTEQNPTHVYTQSGNYIVSLTVTNNQGSSNTKTSGEGFIKVIDCCPVPEAYFSASPDSGCTPLRVHFTDQSTQTGEGCSIVSWLWNFGDGATSTEQNPTHFYTQSGNYIVSLFVTNNEGGSDTQVSGEGFIKVIDCCAYPEANFSASPDSGCVPLTVQFTDLSTQTGQTGTFCYIERWLWNFGDGQTSIETSIEQNPTHTYTSSGYYSVSLTVTNTQGRSNILTALHCIDVIDCCPDPVADFSASPDSGCAPLTVKFTDLSTQTGEGCSIASWLWNFGDGATSTEQNPTHVYTQSGNYIVRLFVTNNEGAVNTKFSSEGFIKVINCCPGPEVYFSASPDSGCVPLTVKFTDLSTQTGEGCSIVSWYWHFGDGAISIEQNPIHIYFNSGKYWVSLEVTNNQGESKIGRQYIKVINCCPDPEANFSASPDSGCTPLQVQFTDLSTQTGEGCSIVSWSWGFGDGGTSTEQNPTHTYTSSGYYSVSLTVTNNDGRWNYITKEGFIKAIDCCADPEVDFSASPDSGCAPLKVQFTDLSTQTGTFCYIVSWFWDFGDGRTSTAQNPTHTYTKSGNYLVSLYATNNGDRSDFKMVDSFIEVIDCCADPEANFSASPDSGCAPLTVQFTDLSTQTGEGCSIVSWSWDFADGQTSTKRYPTYTYTNSGNYVVVLTVTNNHGISNYKIDDSFIKVIDCCPYPEANFSASPDSGCAPLAVRFYDLSTQEGEGCSIVSWSWDFGDGGRSTEQYPTHIYTNSGNYPVHLTITNNHGRIGIKTAYIEVIDCPDGTWTGVGDGTSWDSRYNWSNNHIPTENDDVTIPKGVTVEIIYEARCRNLDLHGTVKIRRLTGSLTIKGYLFMNSGSSITSANDIGMKAAARITATVDSPDEPPEMRIGGNLTSPADALISNVSILFEPIDIFREYQHIIVNDNLIGMWFELPETGLGSPISTTVTSGNVGHVDIGTSGSLASKLRANTVATNTSEIRFHCQNYQIIDSLYVGKGTTFRLIGDLLIGDYAASMIKLFVDTLGTMLVDTSAKLSLYAGTEVSINGEFIAIGEDIITGKSGYYQFDVLSGGKLKASNTIFSGMDTSGINIHTGAIITDSISAFKQCTFKDGQPGGTLLALNNSQTLYIDSVYFPANTWNGSYNVSKTNPEGKVLFRWVSGDFAGAKYENDPYGLIHWSTTMPGDYFLAQNYPNPFNHETMILYGLPEASWVKLDIYNILGQQVATLVDGYKAAGYHRAVWNGANFSSGMYLYRIQAGGFSQAKKLVLLK